MTTKHIISIGLAISLAGCGGSEWGHCDPSSPLNPGITPEQQGECDDNACDWNPEDPSCANGTESGGEQSTDLTCDSPYQIDGDASFCFEGDRAEVNGVDLWNFVHKDSDECHFLAGPIPCNRNELRPLSWPGDECWMCEAADYGDNVIQQQLTTDDMEICAGSPGPFPNYPAVFGNWAEGAGLNQLGNWADGIGADVECLTEEHVIDHRCSLVMLAPAHEDAVKINSLIDADWTCACDDNGDPDCQPGTVCQGGFDLDGIHPFPTLCVRPLENAGAIAYGLNVWSEGVVLEGHTITMTTPMFVEAINMRGLWNDDQMIEPDDSGLTWTLTECGAEGLCTHLGFDVGDVFVFDLNDVGGLESGDAVPFTVLRGGEPESWDIVISA